MRNKNEVDSALPAAVDDPVATKQEQRSELPDFTVAITPAQFASGLAIVAGVLLAIAASRRRRRRTKA